MVEELKKITVDTAPTPTMAKPKKPFPWKAVLIPVGVLLLVIAIIGVMLLPLRGVIAKARDVAAAGKEAATALKAQDLAKTKTGLANTRTQFVALSAEYNKVMPLRFVPILGAYINDGAHAVKAGGAALDAADKAIEALEPNADLLGFTGGSKFVMGSADERIQVAVKTMSALTPKINEMAASVDTMRKELDQIDPNRYPTHIGKTVVREKLSSMKELVENTANLFVNAQPLLKALPNILGQDQSKRYLVLFQNDKELRPTGGFISAYAQFRIDKGKMILEKSDDIYALDGAIKKNFPAPREILTFHKDVFSLHIRDSNLSPDYKTSMQKFEEMYANAAGAEKIDGIMAVDTHVLVEALKILGPMGASGRTFSAEIDKRCDCAKAVYELEDYSSRPVNYVRDNRKDEIGILLHTMLQNALGVSPSQYWGKLFQMLLTEINQKHVMTYFHDPEIQKAAESFNMAGRVMTATETASLLKYQEGQGWDYININNSNMAGAKSNLFVNSKVIKDTTVNGDGTMTTKLTIDYKNPYPGSDCGLESGGLCLNAPLRNWIRIYVPTGSKLVDSKGVISPKDGSAKPMDTFNDLSKTVFEGFLIVNPLGTARLELTYTSPVKETGGKYQVLIQKQSGTDGQEWTLRLGGKDRKKFILETDTEVTL
jgi:hypothetical protein